MCCRFLAGQTYLSDLKLHLQNINSDPRNKDSATAQLRLGSLQTEIATLLSARPDLGSGTSSSRVSVPSLYDDGSRSIGRKPSGSSSTDFFFTPFEQKDQIYTRLVKRIHELLGSETSFTQTVHGESELVEMCAGIWGIANKSEKEISVLIDLWSAASTAQQQQDESIASRVRMTMSKPQEHDSAAQQGWAQILQEALYELEVDASCGYEETEEKAVKETVLRLFNKLYSGMVTSLKSIYPTTSAPPHAPEPTCLPLLTALYECKELVQLLGPATTEARWSEAADELRGEAVSEYVMKTMECLHGVTDDEHHSGAEEDEQSIMMGYEKLADFIEAGVRRVARVWKRDMLEGRLDPPAIILSKQLPLYLAELQQFDQPAPGTKADAIFGVYERTARLLSLSEDYCKSEPIDFDLDNFFEPHVREWLKATEDVETHEWVTRAIGLDSWVPEGALRHSQSVIDLFDFIRRALAVILTDLPLGQYNRACYLIDFSRTASVSITRYATTVQSLYNVEMANSTAAASIVAEVPSAVTGKAGAWLAKGKQAMKTLETAANRKPVAGFMIPPSACVKLTDMGAAKVSVDDLMHAMEADETSRIVRDHQLRTGTTAAKDKPARYIFQITVSRGENLLGKGLSKAADAFVSVHDTSDGTTRVHKTNTLISQIDPMWEETFEYGISGPKGLEVACYDRNLVGKHELIGSARFKLDPAAFREMPGRDVVLPLNPRGTIHLRIEMMGHEKHDVRFHLTRASCALDRAGEDMTRLIVDRVSLLYLKCDILSIR